MIERLNLIHALREVIVCTQSDQRKTKHRMPYGSLEMAAQHLCPAESKAATSPFRAVRYCLVTTLLSVQLGTTTSATAS
jgi:hypothetical protein